MPEMRFELVDRDGRLRLPELQRLARRAEASDRQSYLGGAATSCASGQVFAPATPTIPGRNYAHPYAVYASLHTGRSAPQPVPENTWVDVRFDPFDSWWSPLAVIPYVSPPRAFWQSGPFFFVPPEPGYSGYNAFYYLRPLFDDNSFLSASGDGRAYMTWGAHVQWYEGPLAFQTPPAGHRRLWLGGEAALGGPSGAALVDERAATESTVCAVNATVPLGYAVRDLRLSVYQRGGGADVSVAFAALWGLLATTVPLTFGPVADPEYHT